MGILSTKSPPPSPAGKTPEIPLEDKVRIMQKFGTGLTDEQIAEHLELEERRARNVIENEKRIEQAAAEQVRIDQEKRKIAREELGKRIVVSINRQRIKTLTPDSEVPCPECGSNLGLATGLLHMVANEIRGGSDLYQHVRTNPSMGWGGPRHCLPCSYDVGTCAHCGTRAEILVQMVP